MAFAILEKITKNRAGVANDAEQAIKSEPVNHLRMLEWAAHAREEVAKRSGSAEHFSGNITGCTHSNYSQFNIWTLVCQEIDGEGPHGIFELAHDELRRRGASDHDIAEMRYFAWLTAGWLVYCYWGFIPFEFDALNENDLLSAIKYQYADGWISAEERDRRFQYFRQIQVAYSNPGVCREEIIERAGTVELSK
jgi:hypothetical protein